MRSLTFVRLAAMIAVAMPVVTLAQFAEFQPPSPQELQMTSDPKAPGADAVYLNMEEIADDNLGSKHVYARIKVLTEKGKDLARIEVYYGGEYKVAAIKARTIHPDGTVIPLEVKPEDLLASKSGDTKVERKVFTLPSVEVGSILEYRYDIDYPQDTVSSPMWQVQRPYFVHSAHYAFTPFKAFLTGTQNATSRSITNSKGDTLDTLIWWANLPTGMKVIQDGVGRYSADLTDIPATPDEEWMPPIDSVLYKVMFYYKGSGTSQQFWQNEAKQWSKDVDRFASVSGPIKTAVAGLVAPGDTDLDKAKKLYDAVQAFENTDYTRKKTESEMKQLNIKEARKAEDTLAQKSGSSEDIALLYLAMLRAAGLNAYALKVVNRSHALFDMTYMYPDQFEDTLVLLSTGGKEIMLDPGEKMCPFQMTSWSHALSGAMRQGSSGPAFAVTPDMDYTKNTTTRTGDVTIDDHGSVTGNLRYIFSGQESIYWRQEALRYDESELKKRFDRQLADETPDGIEAHVDHFLGLDQPDTNLIVVVNLSGAMGAATAKRLLLPGFFLESRGLEPFVKEDKRLEPVDMHFPNRISDQITYHFPATLELEGAPADATENWAGHAVYMVKTKSDPGQIIVARSLAHAFTIAKPEEYQDLRGFYQKVATSDQQQVVLRATPASGGN